MRPILVVALCLAVPAGAHAQRFSAMAGGSPMQRHVSYQGTVYEQNGTFFGGAGAATLGPVTIRLEGLMGNLTSDSTIAPDTKVRTTALGLLLQPAPWVALGAKAEGRVFETDLGEVSWRLIGGNVVLTPPLGGSGLEGLVDLTYFASRTVTGTEVMSLAYQATVGISLVTRGPFTARVAYRFERYDFDSSTGQLARLEQFRGAVAGVGVRFGRR